MKKITKKQIRELHAAIDEMVEANPETATALHLILANQTEVDQAVAVKGRKKKKSGKKTRGAKEPESLDDLENLDDELEDDELEDDELEDDELEDDELEDDELEDDIDDETPKKSRRKSKSKKSKSKVTFADISEDEDVFWDTFSEAISEAEISETVNELGLREVRSALKDLGLNWKEFETGKGRSEKVESLKAVLNAANMMVDITVKGGKRNVKAVLNEYEIEPNSSVIREMAEQWVTAIFENG